MRSIVLLSLSLGALGLAGCRQPLAPCDQPFYMDADGDGWGDPNVEPRLACAPSCLYTASNPLDCDDGDPEVSAQLGAVCPADVFGEDPSFQSFNTPVLEYLAWYGAAPKVEAEEAQEGCVAWGGDLATWRNTQDLEAFLIELEGISVYVGFVDLAPNANGGWSWGAESNILMEGLWCQGEPPAPLHPEERLAIVKAGPAWCFGRPSDAPQSLNSGSDLTEQAYAICERPRPYPENF
jgi:hypothetical protein